MMSEFAEGLDPALESSMRRGFLLTEANFALIKAEEFDKGARDTVVDQYIQYREMLHLLCVRCTLGPRREEQRIAEIEEFSVYKPIDKLFLQQDDEPGILFLVTTNNSGIKESYMISKNKIAAFDDQEDAVFNVNLIEMVSEVDLVEPVDVLREGSSFLNDESEARLLATFSQIFQTYALKAQQ